MLSVDSLSKSFGETQVLKNISLDIPDGGGSPDAVAVERQRAGGAGLRPG